MKFRISVSKEKYDSVKEYMTDHGVELDEDAEFLITESAAYPEFLSVRNDKKDRMRLSTGDVVFIEAFGKEIEIHTLQETFYSTDRMYQLETSLNPQEFLRVSKSVIIAKKHVKKIRPTLSMKYILTMSNGTLVDVTRSYYNDFRRFFHI